MYDKSLLDKARPVAVHYSNTPLKEVLDDCLRQQGMSYVLSNSNHPTIGFLLLLILYKIDSSE